MADVKVRKLDDWVVRYHKRRAEDAGRSLEEHLRFLLTDAAQRQRKALLDRMDRNRRAMAEKYGPGPDSAAEIRAERDERERRILGD